MGDWRANENDDGGSREPSGSVLALATPEGEIIESYEYEPYGLPTVYDDEGEILASRTSTVGNRFMFTGREWEPDGEFYHYRHRTYSPHEKRFMQRDPIGLAGGWNVYAYCGGDPVNASDPTGLSAKVIWNPTTWADTDGTEKRFEPLTWFTLGGPGQGGAFVDGLWNAAGGWSIGVLDSVIPGDQDFTDKCNASQQWGRSGGKLLMEIQLTLAQARFVKNLTSPKGPLSRLGDWWRTGSESDSAWKALSLKDKILHEIGQKTLSSMPEAWKSLSAVERGKTIVANKGWLKGLFALSLNKDAWAATMGTGPTALGRLLLPGAWNGMVFGGLHTSNDCE